MSVEEQGGEILVGGRRRRFRRALLLVLALLTVALLGLWLARERLATGYIDGELARRGVTASYEATRIKSKELIFSLFNLSFFEKNSLVEPLRKNVSLKLMSAHRNQFITLGNHLSNLYTQTSGSIIQRLKTIYQKASNLILLIQRKYHLE